MKLIQLFITPSIDKNKSFKTNFFLFFLSLISINAYIATINSYEEMYVSAYFVGIYLSSLLNSLLFLLAVRYGLLNKKRFKVLGVIFEVEDYYIFYYSFYPLIIKTIIFYIVLIIASVNKLPSLLNFDYFYIDVFLYFVCFRFLTLRIAACKVISKFQAFQIVSLPMLFILTWIIIFKMWNVY